MNDYMRLLLDYTMEHRVSQFLDPCAYGKLEELESRNLSELRDGLSELSETQAAALKRCQDACEERRCLELEAMFLAAFSAARKLL